MEIFADLIEINKNPSVDKKPHLDCYFCSLDMDRNKCVFQKNAPPLSDDVRCLCSGQWPTKHFAFQFNFGTLVKLLVIVIVKSL